MTSSILKDGKLINNSLTVPIFIIYFTSLSFLAINAVSVFNISSPFSGFKLWGIIFVGLFLFSFLKIMLIKFFGAVFSVKQIASMYISNQILYYALDGFLLIFPVFLTFFLVKESSETAIYLSLGMLSILSIARVIRGFVLVLKNSKSAKFYLFLYLCTVEFIPLLIALKILFAN
jgi:hypothetical protein